MSVARISGSFHGVNAPDVYYIDDVMATFKFIFRRRRRALLLMHPCVCVCVYLLCVVYQLLHLCVCVWRQIQLNSFIALIIYKLIDR